uniref:hypothetical protein n=1 Tax=Argonema antarcticum TaxID=2942763 RepID=UPI0030DD02C0
MKSNLDTYQQQFNQVEFWSQKQYLIWFHGKDIQKEMQKQSPQYLSLKTFFNWAVTRIDIERQLDLSELRNKISQL